MTVHPNWWFYSATAPCNGQGLEAGAGEGGTEASEQLYDHNDYYSVFFPKASFSEYECESLPSLNWRHPEKHLIHELTQRVFFLSDYCNHQTFQHLSRGQKEKENFKKENAMMGYNLQNLELFYQVI